VQSGGSSQQQAVSRGGQRADTWWVPNPDASDQSQSSRVTLSYRFGKLPSGKKSEGRGEMQVMARVWSAERMGCQLADSGTTPPLIYSADCHWLVICLCVNVAAVHLCSCSVICPCISIAAFHLCSCSVIHPCISVCPFHLCSFHPRL